MKKFIAIVFSFALILTSVTAFGATSIQANERNVPTTEEINSWKVYDDLFFENQEKANNAYQKLLTSFRNENLRDTDVFPDYYGGSYINDEGKLVVYVTGDVGNYKDDLVKRAASDEIILETCQFSFNTLTGLMNTMNEIKEKDLENDLNFNTYSIMDAENRIVVELEEYNQDRIEEFKSKISDSSAIEFVESNGELQNNSNINTGSKGVVGNYYGSFGYRAKKNGVEGIVTAAHLAGLNSTVSVNGTNVGKVTSAKNSGTVDAAFVQITNSSYVPTNTLQGTSNTLSTTISEPGAGTVINKIGVKTGHTTGKVISTNTTATFENVTFTNLTTADYGCDGGDSGGIVYSYIGSTGVRLTLGIHKGNNTVTKIAFYVKANEINSALGISRY